MENVTGFGGLEVDLLLGMDETLWGATGGKKKHATIKPAVSIYTL